MRRNITLNALAIFASFASSSALTLDDTRQRLTLALSSPSGKLTLSPELVIPDPSDMTAILLQTTAIQSISAQVRTAKANAAFVHGSMLALKTFATEQDTAQGRFPGPLPVIYCSQVDDIQELADAGADGLLVSLSKLSSSADVSSVLDRDATFLQTATAAMKCGIQPIPEITIDEQFAGSWKEDDISQLVAKITDLWGGSSPVAVVVSVDRVTDDDADQSEPLVLPPVPTDLKKRIPILGSVRVSGGEGRLGAETARFKAAGYTGAFLRSDCVPGFRLNPDLERVGRFWAACINDLKSTRSKSFSFQSKNNMEKSLGTQWANLQNSVIESGALGDPNEQVSVMDQSNGDYQGF